MNATKFDLDKTRITTAGVMRCCVATAACEYDGQQVEIGQKSKCAHCGTKFTLTSTNDKPKWKPDWQIEEEVSNGKEDHCNNAGRSKSL